MNRWPGADPPLVTYGHNLRLNIDGYELEARQNLDDLRLCSQKRTELCANKFVPSVRTVPATPMDKKLENMDLRYFPPSLVASLEKESAVLEAWDNFDPSHGKALAWRDDSLFWGQDSLLHTIEQDKIVDTLDVGSPILQVDSSCLSDVDICLRTRQGFGALRGEDVYHIYDGDTMHVASGEQTALCLPDGRLMIYDNRATLTYTATVPKHGVGWSKSVWLDRNTLLYVSQKALQTRDLRQADWTSLTGPKRQQYRDAVISEHNLFVMEDYYLAWWDQRMLSSPVLLTEHHLSQRDTSWRLDVCTEYGESSVLASSVCYPNSLVFTFGTDYDYPVSKLDPYLLEFWPNVHPQSQLFREGCRYISSTTGGLFKQELGESEIDDEIASDLGDPVYEAPPPKTNDYRYNPLPKVRQFECGEMREKLLAPPTLPPQDLHGLETYRGYDEWESHVQHMASCRLAPKEPVLEVDEKVDAKLVELMSDWPDPLARPSSPEVPSSPVAPSSQLSWQMPEPAYATQRSALPSSQPSSQPMHEHISFSQPLPSRKKLKRKRNRTEGFG